MPSQFVPQQIGPFDKIGHFSMYAGLGWLVTRNFSQSTGRWIAIVLAVIVASGFGAIDEWHQQYIPGRSTELADWQADTLGAAVGAMAFATLGRLRQRTLTTE